MTKLHCVAIPQNLVISLAAMGRLDPKGRLILDEGGDHSNVLKDETDEETQDRTMKIRLGYLGDMEVFYPGSGEQGVLRTIEKKSKKNINKSAEVAA